MSEGLPRGVVNLAAAAVMTAANMNDDEPERFEARTLAGAALEAAWPLIERHIRRQMAREILHLHAVDRSCTRNVGPWGDMGISLKRIERGEPLPRPEELHGGEGAEHA